MKINIRCDMEGVTGVTSYDQVHPSKPGYAEGRDLLMHDLCAVISGIRDIEPDAEIILFDEHTQGRNVDMMRLPAGVRYVSGKPRYTPDCAGYIESCDAMFLVGFHAKAGTPGALLPHTYEHDILDLKVNETSLGEVGLEALIAGEANVPTTFFSGDSAGAKELKGLIPDVTTVAVKTSVSSGAAICLPAVETEHLLREGAGRAVKMAGTIDPFTLTTSPIELRIRLAPKELRWALGQCYPELFGADGWISIKAPRATDAYARYWAAKADALSRLGR